MAKGISVYIDGANFYGGLTSINKRFTDTKFDFENYIEFLIGKESLVKINYYNALVKKKINEKIWKKQNDFLIDCVKFQNVKLLYVPENRVLIF